MSGKRPVRQHHSSSGGRGADTPSSSTARSEASSSSKASSPTEQPKSQIDFQFLNFSHPEEARASHSRRTVRSHVTRQQHQREHAAAALRRAATLPQQTETDPEETLAEHGHSRTFPLLRPVRRDEQGGSSSGLASSSEVSPSPSPPTHSPMKYQQPRINLAETYPEHWLPYIVQILDHYLSNMALDIPDLDGQDARGLLRTRFFPFVMTDKATLHTVMLMAAAHYGNARGARLQTIDLLQLRGMAIREINGALEDPVRATSDQLIAAVAKMASYEALFGDRRIFNTHMTGLLRMVSLRGGLPALGLDGLLERIILWIDSNAAHITGGHIYFDKAAFPSSVDHPRPDPQRFCGGLTNRRPA